MFQSYVAVIEHGDYWRLLEPLIYEGNVDRWVIPAGFVTDFASIPAIFQPLLPPTGRHNRAAVLHDYLYRVAVGKIPSRRDWVAGPDADFHSLPPWLSRRDADRIFLRAMRELDVTPWRARSMYLGVRTADVLGI